MARVRPLAAATGAAHRSAVARRTLVPLRFRSHRIRSIAIGASTGGTEAIRQVLSRLPADAPGDGDRAAHPASLQRAVRRAAERLLALSVAEAEDGTLIQPGLRLRRPR